MFNFNTNRRRSEADMLPSNGEMSNGGYDANLAAESNGAQASYTMQNPEDLGYTQNPAASARADEINNQSLAFAAKNPGFDMKAEITNPKFVEYVFKNGLSIEDAYFLVHREDLIRDEVMKAMNRAAMRRDRIQENGTGKNSPASVKKNPKDMSDKEIDEIIERVRNGEKISF